MAAARQGEGSFNHTLQQARDNRAEQAAYDAAKAGLEANGIPVADDRPEDSGKLLSYLGLTEEEHQGCPGHAAWLCRVFVYDTDAQGQEAGQEDDGEDDYDEDERRRGLRRGRR